MGTLFLHLTKRKIINHNQLLSVVIVISMDTLNLYVLGLLVTFVVRMDMHKMHVRIIWLISILRSIGSRNNNKDAIT
jgi:hypothetical protein